MNNGQLNITSVQAVTQLVTQESTVPVAVAMDGVPQNGGDFAGLLSGIQSLAKVKAPPDSGQAKQSQIGIGKDQLVLDAAAEEPAVDLLAQLNVSPHITSASDHVAPKAADPEKTDVFADAVPLRNDPSDFTSQMALAVYLQPGRMPEVNIPTLVPVDTLQKVATATEQPAGISASPVEKQARHVTGEPLPVIPVQLGEHSQPLPQSAVAATVPTTAPQPAKSDRMSEVNNLTALPVDKLQNVATVTDQPALFSASPDKIQVEQTVAAPAQTRITLSAITATVPAPDETIVPQGARAADLPSAHPTAPAPSPELELEISLSQPRPVIARVTATPVLTDNRSAALVQEIRGARQRLNPEQQIEKVRTGNEQSVVKEMATSLQSAASAGESTLGSDTSHSSDSNQGQPDSASDNQTLAQNMRGQLSTEHQKVAAVTTKAVPNEPVRQDIPEQVMQQVKERLVQYDVKPGNQQITLTLSPDSLGELKINLNLQGQKLSVEIVTENRTVRDAIVQHTDALKESLARQNITMESFDVTTGGKGSGNQGQNQSAWRELAKQQQQQQQQFWAPPRGYQTAQADLPSGQEAYQRQRGDSMLDIHY